MKTSPQVANYELNKYSYRGFWSGRKYEDQAERIALRDLLPAEPVSWFVDLGGSYGRLLDVYRDNAAHFIVMDYATNDMAWGRRRAKRLGFTDFNLVAANAYFLPFADNSINGGITVRVMHHLQNPEFFFAELARVLRPGGYFVIEFANQFHLKAVMSHALRGDWEFFRQTPYQLPHRGDSQGMQEGQISLIYNFSYRYLKRLLHESGLRITKHRAVSWWRWGLFKKLIPLPLLLWLERLAQWTLSWTNLTPSVFLLVSKPVGERVWDQALAANITELLVNPVSKKRLSPKTLKQVYHDRLWDLREPRPEKITY